MMSEATGDQSLASATILADTSVRRKEFRTRTVLTDNGAMKVVHKVAATPEARAFLGEIVAREAKAAEYLGGEFEVLSGVLAKGRIEYKYLGGQPLLEIIAGHLRASDFDGANALLERYVGKLESLSPVVTVPEEFLAVIAGEGQAKLRPVSCLARGLLDLTPRNILVENDKWTVIDNEWSFDFPVPVAFVLFRAVREIAVGLQREIRQAVSKEMPVIDSITFGLRRVYSPVAWTKYLGNDIVDLGRMLRWELGFQRYVRGKNCGPVGRVTKYPRPRIHLCPWHRVVRLRDLF